MSEVEVEPPPPQPEVKRGRGRPAGALSKVPRTQMMQIILEIII